jgi:alpha-mannosidase
VSAAGVVNASTGVSLTMAPATGTPAPTAGVAAEDGSVVQIGYGHVCRYAIYERSPEGLENDQVRLEIDPRSGGILSLTSRETGEAFVLCRDRAPSLLQYAVERSRPMSAWEVEHTGGTQEPQVVRMSRVLHGAYKASLRVELAIHESRFTLTYELRRSDPTVYLHVEGTWFQRGSEEAGTPVLRLAVPCALQNCVPLYEIPFGAVEREMKHGEEVPALRWAALRGMIGGKPRGLLLLNDSKHGHAFSKNTLTLTLIRASFAPDPLPEIGRHEVHLALRPLERAPEPSSETRHARELEHPIRVISTDAHEGALPPRGSLLGWRAGSAVLSAVKNAEEGEDLIVRAYNPSDGEDEVELRLGEITGCTIGSAAEVDLLERPEEGRSLGVDGGTVRARIPKHGIWSARLSIEKA